MSYNAITGVWENKSLSELGAITSSNIDGGTSDSIYTLDAIIDGGGS
jgi:hypothetical protein